MNRVICVYSSSSELVDQVYFDAAEELGKLIAENGDAFLYGGGTIGLMGASAKAVHKAGGKVIGVIPEKLNIRGVVYECCDELIETRSLRERKSIMDSRSDAFIALPGGFGTLEELMEIITLKQLKYHNKPVVILNVNGFYDKLAELFRSFVQGGFVSQEYNNLFFFAGSAKEAVGYIDGYVPHHYADKWATTENSNR